MTRPLFHRFAWLLPLILSAALFGFAASSCRTEDVLTPEEKVQVDTLDAEVERLAGELAAARAKAEAKAGKVSGPHEDAAAESKAMEEWIAARADWLALIERANAKDAELQAIFKAAQERAAAPVGGLLGMVPGAAPFVPLLLQLGLPWVFDRSRKHMLEGAKSAATGEFGTALANLGKAFGYKHSNTDPRAILEGAEKMARKDEDAELEAAIRAIRAGNFELTAPARPSVVLSGTVNATGGTHP